MSPALVETCPLDAGATVAEAFRIAVFPSEILWVASMVIVGAAAAGATALGPEAFEILALLAAAPTGGPITMTAEGTLPEEVTKGTLLWVPVACA